MWIKFDYLIRKLQVDEVEAKIVRINGHLIKLRLVALNQPESQYVHRLFLYPLS